MTAPTRPRVPPPAPRGINPSRARQAVRDRYARPALVPADLSAPLLALPGSQDPGPDSLPGAVPLKAVPQTVERRARLEPGRAGRDILVQARRWISEGADSLTLQPVMTSVNALTRLRDNQSMPVVACSASGGRPAPRALDAEEMTECTATLERAAGADSILTFAAAQPATYLEDTRG